MVTAERKSIGLVNSIGHEDETQFSSKEEMLIGKFEEGLLFSKPYLFSLADKLIRHYPERKWDILIVDDLGARLPARFIRKVLEGYQGKTIPTYFIQAGRSARHRVKQEQYSEHIDSIVANSPKSSRPLVVSESAISFTTANFLGELLNPKFEQVDFAIVASRYRHPAENIFIGGEGYNIIQDTYNTFEGGEKKGLFFHLARKALPRFVKGAIIISFPNIFFSTNELAGLKESNNPYAASNNKQNVSYFYKRMNLLAQEYLSSYNIKKIPFCVAA